MSLIAWYPLNGNLEDYSGNNNHLDYFNNSSKLVVSNLGKIGKAYQRVALNDGTDYLRARNKIHLPNDATIACWAKVSNLDPGTANGLISNHDHNANSGLGLTVHETTSTDYRISCSTGDGSSRTYTSYYGTTNIKDKWCHLLLRFIKSTNTLSLWVDGAKEWEGVYSQYNKLDYLDIFSWSTTYVGTASFRPSSIMNDIRVYNHAVSELEIKEIAKAKILHYTFDDFQEHTENIISLSNSDAAIERSGTAYPYYIVDITALVRSKWSAQNNKISISFEGKRTGTAGYPEGFIYFTDWTWALTANSPTVEWTYTSNATSMPDPTTKTVYFAVYHMPGSSEGVSYSRNHQVEFKNSATPFVNGIRKGFINDSSGMQNNATLLERSSPKWSSIESKISKGAYHFDNKAPIGAYYYNIETNKPLFIPQQFTISAWIKALAAEQPANNIYPIGWANLCFNGVSSSKTDIRSGIIYHDSASTYISWDPGGRSFYDGEWHHWVITYDGLNGSLKQYKDGILIDSTVRLNLYHLQTFRSFRVGSAWELTYGGSDGYIDDVRVYATSLNSTDILDLYNNTTKISETAAYSDCFYNPVYYNKVLHLDYRTWMHGQTGAVGAFTPNGTAAENIRENDLDPWGETTPIWKTRPEGNSADDGGWNTTAIPIDSNFTYRFSVWVKRPNAQIGGSFYMGMNPAPLRNDNSAVQDNPYFYYGAQSLLAENTWYLLVGHCFYQGYTGGAHPDSGWYTTLDGKISTLSWGNVGREDVKWNPGTTSVIHRAYHFYTANTLSSLNFVYPRLDKINGSEPSIQQLLLGYDSILNSHLNENNLKSMYFLGKEYKIKNGIENGLIAYYPFDKDANDYSPYHNDLFISGPTLITGVKNNSYSFNGTNNYMYSKTTLLNRVNGQELSISCWIKPGVAGARYQEIIANRDSINYNWMLYRHVADGSIQLHGAAQNKSTYIPATDVWVHVVATVDATGVYKLYANSIIQQTISGFTYGVASTQLSIGYFPNTEYYLGSLDEVRLYNRALSEEEIATLYDIERPDGPTLKIKGSDLYLKTDNINHK